MVLERQYSINSWKCGVEWRKIVITKRLASTFAARVAATILMVQHWRWHEKYLKVSKYLSRPHWLHQAYFDCSPTKVVGANGFWCHSRCPLHTHTQWSLLIPLPSHSKSQGLSSCFPAEREISDSEEAAFDLFIYIVYTNRVKKIIKRY